MYFKILVPLDGSTLAERALPAARTLAERSGADLELLTVVPDGDAKPVSPEQLLAEPYLEELAARFESPTRPIRRYVMTGEPANVIVEFARSQGFSLIAMATHGRTGFVRGLLGSVTDEVILNSSVPVLVVNGGKPANVRVGIEIDNVIVPLDGSELAESAIEHGEAMARMYDAELLFLRVAKKNAGFVESSLARHYLTGIASSVDTEGLEVKQHVPTGDAGESVISVATERLNALVVITTRGASGLKRRLRGSVADEVVRGAPVPTMVIPPVVELTGRCMD